MSDNMLKSIALRDNSGPSADRKRLDWRLFGRSVAIDKNRDHRTILDKPESMGGDIESYCDKSITGNKPLFDLTKRDSHARFLLKLNGPPSRLKGNVGKTASTHPSAPFTALNFDRGEICLAQIFLRK
jgi:hypothetical protein